jgi:hypothetical protein
VGRDREKSVALEQDRIRIQPQIKQTPEVQRQPPQPSSRYSSMSLPTSQLRRSATACTVRLALRDGPPKRWRLLRRQPRHRRSRAGRCACHSCIAPLRAFRNPAPRSRIG